MSNRFSQIFLTSAASDALHVVRKGEFDLRAPVFVANFAALPGTGNAGQVYVAVDTGVQYQWKAGAYAVIGGGGGAGFTPRGAWSSGTNYVANDLVNRAGSSYVATAPNINSQPPSGNWQLIASKGDPDTTLTANLATEIARATAAEAALALHRASGILRGYTAGGSTGSPASFTLDYATYDGAGYKITIDGTDYGQGHSSSGAIPVATPLNLPAGWTVTESGSVRTVTCDTNGAHTVTVTMTDSRPTLTSFTDGDGTSVAAVASLNFAPWSGYYFSMVLDTALLGPNIGMPNIAPVGLQTGTWTYAQMSSTTGTVTAPDFASGHTFSISMASNAPDFVLVSAGANDVAPSGNVSEVTLLAAVTGKTTKPAGLGLITADGLDTTWAISLKTAGPTYADIITGGTVMTGINMLLAPSPSEFAAYFAGVANASLVARITGTVPFGGSLTLWTETTRQV